DPGDPEHEHHDRDQDLDDREADPSPRLDQHAHVATPRAPWRPHPAVAGMTWSTRKFTRPVLVSMSMKQRLSTSWVPVSRRLRSTVAGSASKRFWSSSTISLRSNTSGGATMGGMASSLV